MVFSPHAGAVAGAAQAHDHVVGGAPFGHVLDGRDLIGPIGPIGAIGAIGAGLDRLVPAAFGGLNAWQRMKETVGIDPMRGESNFRHFCCDSSPAENVTLRQLCAFVEAAARDAGCGLRAAGCESRAAQVLHLRPPAASLQIKEIESQVGQPLFDRDNRRNTPSRAGEYFLVYARRLPIAQKGGRRRHLFGAHVQHPCPAAPSLAVRVPACMP